MTDREEFSVWAFDEIGMSWPVARFVDVGTAMAKAFEATDIPEAHRVIITDGGDCTCFEWVYGKGITRQ